MSKKHLEAAPIAAQPAGEAPLQTPQAPTRIIVICALVSILCTLVSVAPLLHLAGKTFLLSLPTNPFLLWWGQWLPSNLHLASTYRASMITTNMIEFLLLMALAFVVYGLGALFMWRQPEYGNYRQVMRVIVSGTIVIGLIYTLTPAMLSRDVFVYAGYGRTIAAHHANPYFVTPSAFPHDPLTSYDDWQYATSAYGPLWLLVCAGWSLLLGTSPVAYVLAYRLFDLALHLANILLVAAILQKFGRSPRTVALATLLYAWNPLVLMESSLGAHNDTFMVTLILFGIFLSLRAALRRFAHPSDYLPPAIVFTLAALVKFTAAPIVAFYVVLLTYHALHAYPGASFQDLYVHILAKRSALLKIFGTIVVSGFTALAFYIPFWIRHTLHDIVSSFSSPPSSYYSENSILRAIFNNIRAHGLPAQNSWTYWPTYLFSLHTTWNIINLVALICVVSLGAIWLWRAPTTRSLLLAALAMLGALLLVTPWFFPWYATWLVGLAAACLPTTDNSKARALFAFSITFSATAFTTYLFDGYPPIGEWSGIAWLIMNMPPIVAFLVFYRRKSRATRENLPDRNPISV